MRFIDLFCGIGGVRLVLEKYDGQLFGKNISGLLDNNIVPPGIIFFAFSYNFCPDLII
mgnify:CR=1 FL=1